MAAHLSQPRPLLHGYPAFLLITVAFLPCVYFLRREDLWRFAEFIGVFYTSPTFVLSVIILSLAYALASTLFERTRDPGRSILSGCGLCIALYAMTGLVNPDLVSVFNIAGTLSFLVGITWVLFNRLETPDAHPCDDAILPTGERMSLLMLIRERAREEGLGAYRLSQLSESETLEQLMNRTSSGLTRSLARLALDDPGTPATGYRSTSGRFA